MLKADQHGDVAVAQLRKHMQLNQVQTQLIQLDRSFTPNSTTQFKYQLTTNSAPHVKERQDSVETGSDLGSASSLARKVKLLESHCTAMHNFISFCMHVAGQAIKCCTASHLIPRLVHVFPGFPHKEVGNLLSHTNLCACACVTHACVTFQKSNMLTQ